MMSIDDVKQHFTDETNGIQDSVKSDYNLMDAVEQQYKKELSGGGAKSGDYLKLFQYLSDASGIQAG